MKTLDKMEANLLLDEIGLKIGSWNQIQTKDQSHIGDWINVQAPRAYLLECAQHCAGWLPKGGWKIFQIDNSTGWIDPVQASLFFGLLYGENYEYNLTDRTFLFNFSASGVQNEKTELLISNLIYVFLLFYSHGYVVSSGSASAQYLGIQDGYIYFCGGDTLLAEELVKQLTKNVVVEPPQWVLDIFCARQDEIYKSP